MIKLARNFALCLILLGPIIVALGHAPSYINDYFPVYAPPQEIRYSLVDEGVRLSFEALKNYQCELPQNQEASDVYVSLWSYNKKGEMEVSPTDIRREDDLYKDPALKNILVVGMPAVVGPFIIQVTETKLASLDHFYINILCDRPVLGNVYAKVGPFPFAEYRQSLTSQ